jgi:hypothetical protein
MTPRSVGASSWPGTGSSSTGATKWSPAGLDAADEPEALRHLVTLFDLVTASAGVIDWHSEALTLRKLRDPWAEQVRAVPDTPSAKLLHLVFGDVA